MALDQRNMVHRPATGEAPFGADELFFSRTDHRGVIQSGNAVFQRVADYEWDQLIGAPHKLIRHPDMPKAVFWLLWHTIQQGQPIGAYVKNRARDGLHYWVFAIVTPIEDGYLSVRIKPTSDLLKVVEAEYATLLKLEEEQELTPEESAKLLLGRLEELGFPTYEAFMAHALSTEQIARQQSVGIGGDKRAADFSAMAQTVADIDKETASLLKTFETIRGIPFNMRILASRLESAGGPISVISANYGAMSDEIGNWVRNFLTNDASAFASIQRAVLQGRFLRSVSVVQTEAIRHFEGEEDAPEEICADTEMKFLYTQKEKYSREAADGLKEIERQSGRFAKAVVEMKRLITGLSTTRMMCKIESGRLARDGESLQEIINQLDYFQKSIEERLERVDVLNREILSKAGQLIMQTSDKSKNN